MLRDYLLLVCELRKSGGGVGQDYLREHCEKFSKHKMRGMLKELVGLNFVTRKGNLFYLTEAGHDLQRADGKAFTDSLMAGGK